MQPSVGILASINISWGGIPKQRVFEALVTENGLDGDHQRDLRYHGGPERAVVLYSLDVIQALKRQGHPIGVGAVGENFTVSGLDWPAIVPGTELEIGAVRLLITTLRGTNTLRTVLPAAPNGLSRWVRGPPEKAPTRAIRLWDAASLCPLASRVKKIH